MPKHVRSLAAMLALAAASLAGCVPVTPPSPTSPPPTPSASAPSGSTRPSGPSLVEPSATPALETETFPGSGDISDDSAIWVDPAEPANSLVVADNKARSGGGIGLFNMDGKLVHFRPDGMIGNVDLRAGFPASGSSIILVGGNNRTDNTLALWSLDPATRTLAPVAARSIATEAPNYGFCMYHSRASGKFYAFVTPNGAGSVQQFELAADGAGKVDATPVRSLPVSSITESCVADDELGHLYVGQEGVGVWKYGAEPDAGAERTSVDAVGDGRLEADVEGMSIAYGTDGTGYLFVSSQGNSTIAIYDRAGSNAFRKSFKVTRNGDVDGVTGTDGLAVTMENVGPRFEQGMLVVHDEANSGSDTSNLKYVPLSDVLK